MTMVIMFKNTKKWTWNNTENKKSLSKYRNAGQGKQTLAANFSREKRAAVRMSVIYDFVHHISGNNFREYTTKQRH